MNACRILSQQSRSLLIPKRHVIQSIMSCATVAEGQEDSEMPYVVGHNRQNKEFYIKLKDDAGQVSAEKAVLKYDVIRTDFYDLWHTGVPVAFRGKGIAKILAKAAFDYIVTEDAKMRLSCTYLQKYVKDNPLPQYVERVVWDGD